MHIQTTEPPDRPSADADILDGTRPAGSEASSMNEVADMVMERNISGSIGSGIDLPGGDGRSRAGKSLRDSRSCART
jgi:hypothetical protein